MSGRAAGVVHRGWGPPPPEPRAEEASAGAGGGEVVAEADRKSVCIAVATMLLSIPALVGSWCWPLLVAGMFSGLAKVNTASTRSFSHAITFGIDMAVFTNIVQYAVAKTHASRSHMAPWYNKWGPVLCLMLATLLSLADLVRHLINDAWGTACEDLAENQTMQFCTGAVCEVKDKKFDRGCYSVEMMNEFRGGEGFHHLTIYGWIFTMFCTWTGFILLFIGIFWVINFRQKWQAQWRALRGVPAVDSRALTTAP